MELTRIQTRSPIITSQTNGSHLRQSWFQSAVTSVNASKTWSVRLEKILSQIYKLVFSFWSSRWARSYSQWDRMRRGQGTLQLKTWKRKMANKHIIILMERMSCDTDSFVMFPVSNTLTKPSVLLFKQVRKTHWITRNNLYRAATFRRPDKCQWVKYGEKPGAVQQIARVKWTHYNCVSTVQLLWVTCTVYVAR